MVGDQIEGPVEDLIYFFSVQSFDKCMYIWSDKMAVFEKEASCYSL